MLKVLRTLFPARASGWPAGRAAPSVPAGERVYAIGDVHGRNDLFLQIIDMIDADDAARGPADTTVILLGDLIDRGPDSSGVVISARAWAQRRKVRAIAGNHEEMFLRSFDEAEVLRRFLLHGGRETLLSYPMDLETYNGATLDQLRQMMPTLVPRSHIAFMTAMEDQVRIGDYLFVHAGIRPGVPLEMQQPSDLRWIRGEFMEDRTSRDFVVVHGHTITDEAEFLPTRIGVDTGAYFSGRLTAIGLEGADQWLLTAVGEATSTTAY